MVISVLDPQLISIALMTGSKLLNSAPVQNLLKEAGSAALETGKQLASDSGKTLVLQSAKGVKKAMGNVFTALKACFSHSPETVTKIEETLTTTPEDSTPEKLASQLVKIAHTNPSSDPVQLAALTAALQELQQQSKAMAQSIEAFQQAENSGMAINNEGANITKQVNAQNVGQMTL